jgi:hypothetical protein
MTDLAPSVVSRCTADCFLVRNNINLDRMNFEFSCEWPDVGEICRIEVHSERECESADERGVGKTAVAP